MTEQSPMRVAVIGGGAAGTSVLDALVRNHEGRYSVDVTVYETDKQFGPGRAFQPDSPAALVNQPARHMSVRSSQPDHFLRWLEGRPEPLPDDPNFFVSRTLFGQYLEDCFHRAAEDGAAKLIRTRALGSRVVGVRRAGTGFAVRADEGDESTFDAVFLCTGSSEPVDVYGLSGHPGFVPDAYPLRTVAAGIDPASAVTVLGTGLSAVDVVLELARGGHHGPLRMISRSGYLPGVRNPVISVETRVATPEALRELVEARGHLTVADLGALIARELTAQGLSPSDVLRECRVHAHPHDRLRRHLAAAERGDRWQAVIAEITGSSQIEDAWALFDDAARWEAQRDWHTMAVSLWSPMPMASARTLQALVDDERLEILRGVSGVTPDPTGTGFLVEGEKCAHRADHVINTIRPQSAAIPRRATELVESLLGHGLATAHPFGGLRVDFATNRVVSADGQAVPGLYALGQPAVGELHAATSNLSMIARRAEQSVRGLLGRVNPSH